MKEEGLGSSLSRAALEGEPKNKEVGGAGRGHGGRRVP